MNLAGLRQRNLLIPRALLSTILHFSLGFSLPVIWSNNTVTFKHKGGILNVLCDILPRGIIGQLKQLFPQ